VRATQLFFLLVAAPVLAGSEQESQEVVRRMNETINARDFDALDNLAALSKLGHLGTPAPPGAPAETGAADEPGGELVFDDQRVE